MELRDILEVIWKRFWLVGLGTVGIVAMVLGLTLNMMPVYQAKVTLMVKQSHAAPFPSYTSILTGEDLAVTYAELLKARPLLEIVIANLGLSYTPDDLLNGMITTELVPETQLLVLKVEDVNRQRASDIANEIAFTFISLHSTEQQLENIMDLEQDVLEQMVVLKGMIQYNQTTVSRISTTGLLDEQSTLAQTTLANQQLAYASLIETYLNIRLTQGQLLDVTIVESAIPPIHSIRPNVPLYTLLAFFGGAVFSVGLVMLIEYLDRSLKTSEEVARLLPIPVLGEIHHTSNGSRSKGLITVTEPVSPAAEAYRTLRTNIRFTIVDNPLKTLLITSAEPRAGKTTIVANLGIVFAQTGLNVVLIDMDLRMPQLHQLFDLDNRTGLTDLLIKDIQDIDACLVKTGIEGLRLLPSGPIPPNPSELLGTKRLEAILDAVKEHADLIIIDSPPAFVVTDAAVLSPKVDGVLLLVEVNRTSRDIARRTYQALHHVGAVLLGVVLTKVKIKRRSQYYYYQNAQRSAQTPLSKHRKNKGKTSHAKGKISTATKPGQS